MRAIAALFVGCAVAVNAASLATELGALTTSFLEKTNLDLSNQNHAGWWHLIQRIYQLQHELAHVVQHRANIQREISQVFEPQARDAANRRDRAINLQNAANSNFRQAQNEVNPVANAKAQLEGTLRNLQAQMVNLQNQLTALRTGADAAGRESKIDSQNAAATREAIAKLERDIEAITANLNAAKAAAADLPSVKQADEATAQATDARSRFEAAQARIRDQGQQINDNIAKLSAEETRFRTELNDITNKQRAASAVIEKRNQQLLILTTKLSHFQDKLRADIETRTKPITAQRLDANKAQALAEQEKADVMAAKAELDDRVNKTTLEIEGARFAQNTLRSQREAEMQSVRVAMERAAQAAVNATTLHEDLKQQRTSEIARYEEQHRKAVAEARAAMLAFQKDTTILRRKISDSIAAAKAAALELQQAGLEHEQFKAQILEQKRRVDEEIAQLQYRIQQEEIAYEAVRKRLEEQRISALAEMQRLKGDEERAEASFNSTLARLQLAHKQAESILTSLQDTAEQERAAAQRELAELEKQAVEGRKQFDAEMAELRVKQQNEIDGLNANITAFAQRKLELQVQIRNLVSDKNRLQQDIDTVSTRILEQRKELLQVDAEKRTLQTGTAELEVKARTAQAAIADVQKKLNAATQRVKQTQAEAAGMVTRKAELEKQLQEMQQQEVKLTASAEAIEHAIATVRMEGSNGPAGARAVQEALFKLGKQLEDTEAEKNRIEEEASEVEREVEKLMAAKTELDAAVADINARVGKQKALGVTEVGVDSALSSFAAAQSTLDSVKTAIVRAEAENTQLRNNALAERSAAVQQARRQLDAAQESLNKLKEQLAAVRAGTLPAEVQARMDALKAARKSTEVTSIEDIINRVPAPKVPAELLSAFDSLKDRISRLQTVVSGLNTSQTNHSAEPSPKVHLRTRVFVHKAITQTNTDADPVYIPMDAP